MAIVNFVLIIVATFFILEIESAVNPAQPITTLKNRVKSASDILDRYNRNLVFNARTKLNNLKFNQMTNVNTAVNNALTLTQQKITSANNQGHDADKCYEPLRLSLNTASKKAFDDLDACVENELTPVKGVENNIDNHLLTGKLLLNELDGIAISCAHGTTLDMQICIGQKLPNASLSVKNFENTCDSLKGTGDSLSSSVQNSGLRCFQSRVDELNQAVTSGRNTADQCINSS
ncbi:uncharacterized protein LOC122849975 [Aphidius gifuensis]|uniref:uncharacterized protein LOC122849975 n=1 Tax=Aphidius gifuensis TaxID=684658 RepID=UPI001CDC0701|nr:uncharacterized protein LOC122849975 [Aphidius gifuensis]